jgi:membrane protease YdiL (CAAX protease family)
VFRDTLPDGIGQATAILGGVLTTAVAGMFFSWMRNRSDSIVAPATLHTTTNSVGYLLAWLSQRM